MGLKQIEHLSFDAWNTLISPNLEFSRLRSQAISDAFGVTFEEAKKAYTATKKFLDTLAEVRGIGLSTPEAYQFLEKQLKSIAKKSVDLNMLKDEIDSILASNPPHFLPETIELLFKLVEGNYTVGILSNTNFIDGDALLREVFSKWDVPFISTIFSDRYQVAKPSKKLFSIMVSDVKSINSRVRFNDEILHIGDNAITDGSVQIGIRTLVIKDPNDLIVKMEEMLLA